MVYPVSTRLWRNRINCYRIWAYYKKVSNFLILRIIDVGGETVNVRSSLHLSVIVEFVQEHTKSNRIGLGLSVKII